MNYQKVYDRIIGRAKTRKLEGYKEKHHIVPKCLGGGNEKGNLVELLPEEHYICHLLLHRMYPTNKKLEWAFLMMVLCRSSNQQRKPVSNKTYSKAKERIANLNRENISGRVHIYNPDTLHKMLIPLSNFQEFEKQGYILGHLSNTTKGRVQIRKDGMKKYINPSELETYTTLGWKKGGLSQSNGGWKGKRKGENNPTFGKVWVFSETLQESKLINQEDLDLYLQKGFGKGRKIKSK